MKLSDCIIDTPLTGECKIDVDNVCRCFGFSILSRWHEQYRLINLHANVKVTISKKDALEIIERLNLIDVPSGVFANGSTLMTEDRLKTIIKD